MSIDAMQEISAGKDQERQLTLLKATLEASADGLFVASPDARIITYNRRFLEIWNITDEDIKASNGTMPVQLFEQLSDFENFLAGIAEMNEHPNREFTGVISFKDGRIIESDARPLWVEGELVGRVFSLRDVTERKRSEAKIHSEIMFSETLVDSLPGIFYMVDQTGQLKRWNKNYQALFGLSAEELVGLSGLDRIAPEDRNLVAVKMQEAFEQGLSSQEANLIVASGERVPYYLTGRRISIDGVPFLLGVGIDISERKQAEAERVQLQEEIIAAQEATLRELSTPLIPFSNDVVVMPLIGTVDSQRAQLVLETLLEGIASSRASVAILDITGVAVVDTQVANALLRAAQAVKLLGAQVVLTGIRPEVAQTLVGLGIDLGGIVTRGTLQSGIAFALDHTTSERWAVLNGKIGRSE